MNTNLSEQATIVFRVVTQSALLTNLVKTAAILILALILKALASRAVVKVVKSFEDSKPQEVSLMERRAQTLGKISTDTIDITILTITIISILAQWGIDIRPILTGAGIVGIAIGFGSQALVRDIVTGFFVLLENQFNYGDKITIGGLTGKVIDMKLRTTMLEGENGEIYTIPNSQISAVTRFPKTTSNTKQS